MCACLVEQVHELAVEQLSSLARLDLPLASQCLVETLALREPLELIDTLISFADSLFPRQVYFTWVHWCDLQFNHALSEVSE